MKLRGVLYFLIPVMLIAAPRFAVGQERGAAALDQLLRGITVTPRVLMIAAHPDDEDTQLLSWLTRERQVHAAYLSLTRGDGGQNLIGNELGESLGAIRTEELIAARQIDGAEQYFSRAYDFGFSKSAEETFTQWDREQLAGDVVRVIRAFRPHVIVSVFSGTPTDGHGHHQAAGILAREGFEFAMDTVRFPTRTHGRPWEPAKFYRGAWSRNRPATHVIEVGGYDPVLGRSPAEIAGESRSQHRSQGFGVLQRRGSVQTRLTRELSRVNESTPPLQEISFFDGIDTSFARHGKSIPAASADLDSVAALVGRVSRTVDLRQPGTAVSALAQVVELLERSRAAMERCGFLPPLGSGVLPCSQSDLDYQTSVERAHKRAQLALLEAAGVAFEVTAERELVAFGDSVPTRITVYNRGGSEVRVTSLRSTGLPVQDIEPVLILPDSGYTFQRRALGLVDHRPWWPGARQGTAMFSDSRSPEDGVALISYGRPATLIPSVAVAEGSRRLSAVKLGIEIAGVSTTVDAGEIVYRFADPVLGEQNRPVGGVPPITITLDRVLEYVRADVDVERRIRVTIQSRLSKDLTVQGLSLVPDGLRLEGWPDSMTVEAGETRELFVVLKGRVTAMRHEFGLGLQDGDVRYVEGFSTIEYPHIRPLRMYRSSAMYLQGVNLNVPRNLSVLYVAGVSDLIGSALTQLDIRTQVISAADLPRADLSFFTTVVIGPRAYGTHRELIAYNPQLFSWVESGGTLVVQYGQFEMAEAGVLPYPVSLTRPAARVTDEGAEVRVLEPASQLLRWPNAIDGEDWNGWVQERALYMPTEIDSRYRTPLSMNDPDEPENRAAILETSLGSGRYIYTTLSLFRQIPAGVSGGVRLLVNMLSAGLSP